MRAKKIIVPCFSIPMSLFITTHLHYRWGDTSTAADGWYNASNVTYNNTAFQYNMTLTRHISSVDYWPDEY